MNQNAMILSLCLLPGALSAGASRVESVYTSLDDTGCKAMVVDEETGAWSRECPGPQDRALLWSNDDARESLAIKRKDKLQDLAFFGNVTSRFNQLGPKAEWRLRDGKPIALIVRMIISESETPPQTRSVLIVSKLSDSEACVVKIIDASKQKNANAAARKAADGADGMACLWRGE